ncbi:hypothetical protein NKR23_g5510 [Pleurostoma richardsiae]|uniref:Uncharacterized protein n=1 Tax=Pleurostoma richardsiae TaxID=41990 RepID=A0AA38RNC4_9PEZI|nr:hypothetical protein NKR23_g5510 [Pleurostoma richardsiae]
MKEADAPNPRTSKLKTRSLSHKARGVNERRVVLAASADTVSAGRPSSPIILVAFEELLLTGARPRSANLSLARPPQDNII